MGIKVTELGLGVKLIEPDYFEDYRGYYSEIFSERTLKTNGIDFKVVQDNEAYSLKKGTVRGIHFQNEPYSQSKLLRCVMGKIVDYAIDLRRDSPTFKQYVMIELHGNDHKQIFIPKGFGHLCISLEDNTAINYKVDNLFEPDYDRAINFNDSDINIELPNIDFIVSEKDKNAPMLSQSDVNFFRKRS